MPLAVSLSFVKLSGNGDKHQAVWVLLSVLIFVYLVENKSQSIFPKSGSIKKKVLIKFPI